MRPRPVPRIPAVIRDALLPVLRERFPGRGLREGAPPGPVAVFPPAHPEVGPVEIYDDGDEVSIFVGTITHLHIGPWTAGPEPVECTPEAMAEDVASFLEDLFADRTLLWRSASGSGGSLPREGECPLTLLGPGDETFVWSGPVPNPRG